MNKKFILPVVLGMLSRDRKETEVSIPSHKVEQKVEQEKKPEQISKRKFQKMKGKRTRKNRGRNRRRK